MISVNEREREREKRKKQKGKTKKTKKKERKKNGRKKEEKGEIDLFCVPYPVGGLPKVGECKCYTTLCN